MPKPKKTSGKWEIFTIHYQDPVFGQEGVYHKEVKTMIVSTPRGMDDATEACKKFHHGARVICTLDSIQEKANGDNNVIVNGILEKKGWK